MFCKNCNNEIPDDSIYCKNCGKKVIEKKLTKNDILLRISFLFILITAVISVAFIIINGKLKNSRQIAEATEDTQIEQKESDTKVITSKEKIESDAEETNFTSIIPKDFNIQKVGHAAKEFVTGTDYYFVSEGGVYKSAFDGSDITNIYSESAENIFFREENIFIQSKDRITKLSILADKIDILIQKDNIEDFFVTDEFIFYSVLNSTGALSLYRMNVDGKRDMLVAEDIYLYNVNVRDSSVLYAQISYDTTDFYEEDFLQIGNTSADEKLVFFSCDFAGDNSRSFAEMDFTGEVSDFTDMSVGLKTRFALTNVNGRRKDLYIIDMANLRFDIIENIKDFIYGNEEIYYTVPNPNNGYLYDVLKFVPYIDGLKGEDIKVTSLPEYNDIYVKDNIIYYSMKENFILTSDVLGQNKKGIFEADKYGVGNFGKFVHADRDKLVCENMVINFGAREIVFFDRERYTHRAEVFEMYDSEYAVLDLAGDGYLNYLLSDEFLGEDYVFALFDINSDNISEMIFGERENIKDNIFYFPYFEDADNIKIYYFEDDIKLFEISDENILVKNNTIYHDLSENRLVFFSDDAEGTFVNRLNPNNRKLIPVLKKEQRNGESYYYEYQNSVFLEITELDYNRILNDLSLQLAPFNAYSTNEVDIIRGIYFRQK